MTTQATFALSKPTNDDRVPVGTLAYFQARNRARIYDTVINEFERSGITQATLAKRMGKGADWVCRLLGAPGNWTLDTVSDLLFAIPGGEAAYDVSYPLDQPKRNLTKPIWLDASPPPAVPTPKPARPFGDVPEPFPLRAA
jgi:hypothetical protein